MRIETSLIEREEMDKAVNLALLTNEHMMVAGPPGTGKSMHADRVFAHFPRAKKFKAQLSKFSTEEILFGPLDVAELRKGNFVYNYENTILDAHFAFIDEIFDASDVLLRSLLGVLNEREFSKGGFHKSCPLRTAIATANYSRSNEKTEAIVDRFLFQVNVKPLSKDNKFKLLDFNQEFKALNSYTLKQLDVTQRKVKQVIMPSNVARLLIELGEKLGFTDRRIAKTVNVIKANAYMRGSSTTSTEDLMALKYTKSLTTTDEVQTRDILTNYVEVMSVKVEQMDTIDEITREWENLPGTHEDLEHLQQEVKVLNKLRWIDPVDSDVSERRDEYLEDWIEHNNYNKKQLLEGLGLD